MVPGPTTATSAVAGPSSSTMPKTTDASTTAALISSTLQRYALVRTWARNSRRTTSPMARR
ncbi:Uncharacterised protein [Mycobacteroides abscessus subsp. abscessus]|nr:Uncharacterised protein [Mycobacteroides abscessus subsp. abscessus]